MPLKNPVKKQIKIKKMRNLMEQEALLVKGAETGDALQEVLVADLEVVSFEFHFLY